MKSLDELIYEAKEEYRRHERLEPILLDGISEMHARNALNHLINHSWNKALTEAKVAASQRPRWEHFAQIVATIHELNDV
jgi:hypothetical protein